MSQICLYGVIALSLTVLTGWSGQVSLGQFGLVAVGADMAAHLGSGVPLILLLPFAGVVTAVVSVLVGPHRAAHPGPLPGRQHAGVRPVHADVGARHLVLDGAARAPRDLLRAPRPAIHAHLPADAARAGAVVGAGLRLVLARGARRCRSSWCGCGATGASPDGSSPCATTRWRRARPASPWCGRSSWPSPCRGSSPATPGCASPSPPSASAPHTFDPSLSILVVSMVVIGGLDSIAGAIIGRPLSHGAARHLRVRPPRFSS